MKARNIKIIQARKEEGDILNRPIDEQKILNKGLAIFAKIIAQAMVRDGVGQNFQLTHEKKRNMKRGKIKKRKLVA